MGAPGMRLPQRALRRLPYRAICCIDTVDTLPWSFQALPTQPKEGKANLGRASSRGTFCGLESQGRGQRPATYRATAGAKPRQGNSRFLL
jgi:hypothetical protein